MAKKTQIVDFKNEQIRSRTASFFDRMGSLLGMSHDGQRDMYSIYGYEQNLSGDYGFDLLYKYSRRHGIANRLTFGMAKSCWRDGFTVLSDREDESSEQITDALVTLNRRGLIKKLEQADILNRIGRFSVLLVGVPDGLPLNEPIGTASPGALDTVYFKAFAYDGVRVIKSDTDPLSIRYGLPELYSVQSGASRGENEKDTGGNLSLVVHWSRLIHLNENALDSEVEGMGALEPIFNRILDLDKATGGSSEAYFRNARGKVGYEIDKDFAASILTDPDAKEAFDEAAKKFTNQWQDHTVAAGATVKTLPTAHQTPLDTVRVALWEISGYSGIPIRILTGEGSGQLAGSEDQLALNHIIQDRQRVVCSGWVVRLLDILSGAGMVEFEPGWTIHFPQQRAATEAQQAEIDNRKADTLLKSVNAKSAPGGDELELESVLDAFNLSDIELDDMADISGEEMEL